MFTTRGNDINSSGVDAAVAEDIGELGNVFFQLIKCPCK